MDASMSDGADRSESQRRLLKFVDAYNRDKRKEFDEFKAIVALKEAGALNSLPWVDLGRGQPGPEPDWVSDQPNEAIPIGFEVTQPKLEAIFRINQRIRALAAKSGGPSRGQDIGGKAFAIVAGDPEMELNQCAYARCTVQQAAEFILRAVDAKKTKLPYRSGRYRLHLILHEPRLLFQVTDGSHEAVLEKVARADQGSFVAIWHVDWNSNVTLLKRDGTLEAYRRRARRHIRL